MLERATATIVLSRKVTNRTAEMTASARRGRRAAPCAGSATTRPVLVDDPGGRASSGALEHLDGRRQLLLDLRGGGHDENLPEPAPETLEGCEHPGFAVLVERPEDFVEDEETDRAAGLEVDVLADGHPQGEVGEVHLGAGEALQAVLKAAVADLDLVVVGVHLEALVLAVGQLGEQ